jgi:hypothetical protein
MTRRSFLRVIATTPAVGGVWASMRRENWRLYSLIGYARTGSPLRMAQHGDLIVGYWNGSRIVTNGPVWLSAAAKR